MIHSIINMVCIYPVFYIRSQIFIFIHHKGSKNITTVLIYAERMGGDKPDEHTPIITICHLNYLESVPVLRSGLHRGSRPARSP